MMKKKVHKLRAENGSPYRLLGISSHENDYRLSWAVNRQLGLKLSRADSIVMEGGQETGKLDFSVFQYSDHERMSRINLISNRCPDGFLIKEFRNIDFFLQVFGETTDRQVEEIISGLKSIGIVSAVFEISAERHKKSWELPPE